MGYIDIEYCRNQAKLCYWIAERDCRTVKSIWKQVLDQRERSLYRTVEKRSWRRACQVGNLQWWTRTKVTVQVKLLKFNAPAFVFDMETESIAKYQIVARNTGKVIYETEVTAIGDAGLNENFSGATRWKNPVNRSGQNNIKAFISRLEAVAPEINKILSSQQFF